MSAGVSSPAPGDARLWAFALAASLLANVALLACFGIAAVVYGGSTRRPVEKKEAAPIESVVVLVAPAVAVPEPEVEPDVPEEFARTSEEQRAARPERPRFMGERDTRATSNAAPDAEAPPLPAQEGEDPRSERDLSTVESDFQDSPLDQGAPAAPAEPPAPPVPPPGLPMGEAELTGEREETSVSQAEPVEGARETLLEGPNPVDVPVPPAPEADEPEPLAAERPRDGVADASGEVTSAVVEETPRQPRPPVQDPAFRSEQRKTAIRGSIGRTGVGSLDVADTPMGRYQAAISKAVELEWQRNCVRHRDFIQPGFLTVRFFVQPDGKVGGVQFLSEMETGQVQKGFTHTSIRDAKIPAMPQALRDELGDEPLELIFNFYF